MAKSVLLNVFWIYSLVSFTLIIIVAYDLYLLLFRYEDLHESLNVFGTPVLLPSSAKKHR